METFPIVKRKDVLAQMGVTVWTVSTKGNYTVSDDVALAAGR
jgi:hypothetical protein